MTPVFGCESRVASLCVASLLRHFRNLVLQMHPIALFGQLYYTTHMANHHLASFSCKSSPALTYFEASCPLENLVLCD